METKVCSKCSTEKPATDFHNKQSWCKVCFNEYKRLNSKPRKRDSQLDKDRQARYREEARQRFDSGKISARKSEVIDEDFHNTRQI